MLIYLYVIGRISASNGCKGWSIVGGVRAIVWFILKISEPEKTSHTGEKVGVLLLTFITGEYRITLLNTNVAFVWARI